MENNIHCKNLVLGKNVTIEPTAVIRGLNGKAENISFGVDDITVVMWKPE